MWHRVWTFERKRKGKKRKGKKRTTYTYCLRWFGEDGRVRTEAVGTDRRLAEQLRRHREAELNSGAFQQPKPIALGAFTREHLILMPGQVTERTLVDQEATLRRFQAYCGDLPLGKIAPGTAEGFFAARLKTVSPATANKDVRTLKAIFQRAVNRGYLKENPFRNVKPAREPEREIRVLSVEEVERLLDATPNLKWRTLLLLALTTGMRYGELRYLEWGDVDFEAGLVHVRCKEQHRTKSARNRVIALVPAVVEMLTRLRPSEPAGYVFRTEAGTQIGNNVLRTFRGIVKRAGIEHCTVHDLRRTFISHLAMAGVSEAVAQQLAGHSSISTTLRHYTRILPDSLRAAPLRLPYAGSASGVSKVYREGKIVELEELARVTTPVQAVS